MKEHASRQETDTPPTDAPLGDASRAPYSPAPAPGRHPTHSGTALPPAARLTRPVRLPEEDATPIGTIRLDAPDVVGRFDPSTHGRF